MNYNLELMYEGGNLEGYHVTCYHCLCHKGTILEEYNSVTGKLYVTIDCLDCKENFKVKYINEDGFKSFDLLKKDHHSCLDNGLCGGDPCIIKEL